MARRDLSSSVFLLDRELSKSCGTPTRVTGGLATRLRDHRAASTQPPKDYRSMTMQELRAAALESIEILQERLRRTGRLSG